MLGSPCIYISDDSLDPIVLLVLDAPVEGPRRLSHNPVHHERVGGGVRREVLAVLVLVERQVAAQDGAGDPEAAGPSLLVLEAVAARGQRQAGTRDEAGSTCGLKANPTIWRS